MIQPNELRIGNWVQCDGEYFQSTAYTPLVIERGEKDIDPIPITPEVLEKCGFRNCEEESFLYLSFSDGTHNIYIHTDGGVVFEPFMVNYKHFGIRIFYLHQLQNLYFALTWEELNYTP